jgi:hypothetical protein
MPDVGESKQISKRKPRVIQQRMKGQLKPVLKEIAYETIENICPTTAPASTVLPRQALREPFATSGYMTASASRYDSLPRPLPISPLMDPAFFAARAKYTARKSPPTKGDAGSFHARLAKNPYALALATPIRRCQLSEAMLPTFFLQDYNIMAHPESGEPWYMPTSLTKFEPGNKRPRLGHGSTHENFNETSFESMELGDTKEDEEMGNKVGYNVYTISSMRELNKLHQTKFKAHTLIPNRLRRINSAMNVASIAVWRQDMGVFLHTLWQRRISEHLTYLKGLKKGYVVDCEDWEDAKRKTQVGAFLWIGTAEGNDNAMKPPQQWATIDIPYGHRVFRETRKVPVYNMQTLLGEEPLAELKIRGILKGKIVVVKDKKVTLNLRMKLWKFQGFLAVPEQEKINLVDKDGSSYEEGQD